MTDPIQPVSRGVGGTIQTAIWALTPGQMGRRAAQVYEGLFGPRRAAANAQAECNRARDTEATARALEERIGRIDQAAGRQPSASPEPVIDLRDPVVDVREAPQVSDDAFPVHAIDHFGASRR